MYLVVCMDNIVSFCSRLFCFWICIFFAAGVMGLFFSVVVYLWVVSCFGYVCSSQIGIWTLLCSFVLCSWSVCSGVCIFSFEFVCFWICLFSAAGATGFFFRSWLASLNSIGWCVPLGSVLFWICLFSTDWRLDTAVFPLFFAAGLFIQLYLFVQVCLFLDMRVLCSWCDRLVLSQTPFSSADGLYLWDLWVVSCCGVTCLFFAGGPHL